MIRAQQLHRLQNESFDVLVIGGGATGCGVALDAASRGLRVALVERGDFAVGTSSRSTKLIHGGVRYLERAVKRIDRSQFRLVREALRERATLLRLAPHLVRELPIFIPLYRLAQEPYYRIGLNLYDRLAGKHAIRRSAFVGRRDARERFPHLAEPESGAAAGRRLRGGVIYYDGQFDDARMNVALALTAAENGATLANYVRVDGFAHGASGAIETVSVTDVLGGQRWAVRTRSVINATGPFVDELRRLDEPGARPILAVSGGTHLVLGGRFPAPPVGFLIPRTEDRRVIFVLPWQGHTLVGTTEVQAAPNASPEPSDDEIEYLLGHLRYYLNLHADRTDVVAAWSGLRPLIAPQPRGRERGARRRGTAAVTRDHHLEVSRSGLVTIAGGKWTTYRVMAVHAVNCVVSTRGLVPVGTSRTRDITLAGGEGYGPDSAARLQRDYALPPDVTLHLDGAYGSRATEVAALAADGLHQRLADDHPYIEAEVVYAARREAACTVGDVLARRTRLTFLDRSAAARCAARVAELLADELGWSTEQRRAQAATAVDQSQLSQLPSRG